IIIDTPPSLSLLTVNALSASDEVIIPIQTEYYALEGLSQLVKTIDLIKTNLNKKLKIGGIILTMYDSRLVLSNQVKEEVEDHFGDVVFKTSIPRNVRLSEAPSHGMPILYYDPTSSGSLAYETLAREIIEKNEIKEEPAQMMLTGEEICQQSSAV
ncbi:MAG: ParA family protein, partial [Candidatus Margulisiibacteriota bacterium]